MKMKAWLGQWAKKKEKRKAKSVKRQGNSFNTLLAHLGIKRLDWYIIKKFLGTYLFSIALIISIAMIFDYNERIERFSQSHVPWKKIIFDYYLNFIPYFANLFSALFVFISVIFFTSKLADNSEIIAMKAAGVSFKRLLRPYMISAGVIALATFLMGAYIIPRGNEKKLAFTNTYIKKQKITTAENVQMQIEPGVVAFISHFDMTTKSGYGFSLDKFVNKKLVAHLTAQTIRYDTLAESPHHWKLTGYKIRELHGLREKISSGQQLDTIIKVEPSDFFYTANEQESMTLPELSEFIEKQTMRGAANVVNFEIEYHKRIANPFAAFILTIIGLSLSCQKRKGGMGLSLGIGLALSFTYILFQTISATFAVKAGWPPILSVWLPNIIFIFIAWYLYRKSPQ